MVTVDSLKKKEVVVYGTGINAVKCVSFLEKQGIYINYVLDGKSGIGKFKNYSVYDPCAQSLDGKFIIVACAQKTYTAIKEKLSGYQEFQDYIYYGWLDKGMVFLHGNCHMDIIEAFLLSSEHFQEKYAVYPTPRICTREPLDESILEAMDIWIHEDIQSRNAIGYEISDEYLRPLMAENVMEIIMPHLYGLGAGFFPHAKERNDKNTALLNGEYENGMFPQRDDVIDRCMTHNMGIDQICRYVREDCIIPQEYIIENFHNYIDRIRERERDWDIKILDFILAHYKTQKLFYDIGHPTNFVLGKISTDILRLLGITDKVLADERLDYHEIPVYPWIGKVLGLEWSEAYIRTSEGAIKCRDEMDIAEYVREYVWWCYPERVKGIE